MDRSRLGLTLNDALAAIHDKLTEISPLLDSGCSDQLLSKLDALVRLSCVRELCTTDEDRKTVGAAFSQVINMFVRFSNLVSEYYKGSASETDRLVAALSCESHVVSVLANVTDYSQFLCQKLVDPNILRVIMTQLDVPAAVLQTQLRRESNLVIVQGLLIVLYNVSRSYPQTVDTILQLGGIDVVKRYVESGNDLIKMQALFVFSFMIVTSRNEETDANAIVTKDNIDFILTVLRDCYDEDNHFSKVFGFNVLEVLQSLSDIAHCSHRGVQYLLDTGRMCVRTLLYTILAAPALEISTQKQDTPTGSGSLLQPTLMNSYRYVRFASESEKLAAAHFCWALSYDPHGRDSLNAMPGLVAALRIAVSSSNSELQRIAYGTLWNLGVRDQDATVDVDGTMSDCSGRPDGRPSTAAACGRTLSYAPETQVLPAPRRYVMISYQHQNSEAVRRIRNAMRDANIDVWVDYENMSGNILNKIMKAVQRSTLVLLCISASYKRSAYCRSEAENAFICKKRLIPVRLDSYQPSGWLQAVVGAKYIHDLSQPDKFDTTVIDLVASIRAKMQKDDGKQLVKHGDTTTLLNAAPAPMLSHVADVSQAQQSVACVPATATATATAPTPSVDGLLRLMEWKQQDVQQWLLQERLGSLTGKLDPVDGPMLYEILQMEGVAPKYLYNKMEQEFAFSFVDLLKFLRSLHDLRQRFEGQGN